MKSLTIHNIDDLLYQRLAEVAADQNLSLNATVKSTLGDALGTSNKRKKRDLSMLFGMWTKEEGEAFDKYLKEECERIDPEDWK